MASKTLLFSAILLPSVAAPVAQAQLLGLGRVVISGTVYFSNGTPTATTAVFPNALVQLQCAGSVVSTATTDTGGVFTMSLSAITTSVLPTLMKDCKLVVDTHLSNCNALLPTSGILQSALKLVDGGLIGGLLSNLINMIPTGFFIV